MMFRIHRSRPFAAAATAAALGLALTGCGSTSTTTTTPTATSSDEPAVTATPTEQVSETPGDDAKVIDITLDGKTVDPSGRRVEVALGQKIVLRINASQEGELHVHSSPEQEISFPAGKSEATLTLDRPGIVDVEDHDLDALIVQLQVS